MPNMIGLAVGIPELGKGVTNAHKDSKAELKKTNKYDEILGTNTDNFPALPKPEDISKVAYQDIHIPYDQGYEEYEHPLKENAKYIIPAALLGATLVRGRATGNMLQFPKYDIPKAVGKVVDKAPNMILDKATQSRNPAVRAAGKGYRAAKKESKGVKNESFAGGLKSGAGWAVGMGVVEHEISKGKKSNNTEKTAGEVFGPLGYARKFMREGLLQPGIQSVPMYITPVGVSYMVNKDVRDGFGPVRDLTDAEKKRQKGHTGTTDYRSRNNIAINESITKFASSVASEVASDAVKKGMRIKDWKEFWQELPINGARAVALAAPMTFISQYDPTQRYKMEQGMQAQKAHDKQIVRKAVKAQKAEIAKVQSVGVPNTQKKDGWFFHEKRRRNSSGGAVKKVSADSVQG